MKVPRTNEHLKRALSQFRELTDEEWQRIDSLLRSGLPVCQTWSETAGDRSAHYSSNAHSDERFKALHRRSFVVPQTAMLS